MSSTVKTSSTTEMTLLYLKKGELSFERLAGVTKLFSYINSRVAMDKPTK
jgi:hypothetical protein